MQTVVICCVLLLPWSAAFVSPTVKPKLSFLTISSSETTTTEATTTTTTPDFNSVFVAKEGDRGATTASEQAQEQRLSLGAPPERPVGGHFRTKGGVPLTVNIEGVPFSPSPKDPTGSSAAIENLVQQLDSKRGVLLTSSYEFPGRYARWSLGFVDPPLELSGKDNHCTIRALNERGRILMPSILRAMNQLQDEGALETIETTTMDDDVLTQLDVTVVPPPEVGTFDEEERSRQVSR